MGKSLLALGFLAALGSGTAFVAAGERGPAQRTERLKQQLGLTDAQAEQLQSLRAETRKANIERRAQKQIARLELMDLLKAPVVDEAAVRAKARQLGDLQASAARARAEAGLALRKIVSPEQAASLLEMRSERQRARRANRGVRRGSRGRPQGGGSEFLEAPETRE